MIEATIQRCKDYYENVYQMELDRLHEPQLALDECIQHFLDQRPTNKKLSNRDRATAFVSSCFLRDVDAVLSAKKVSLALSKVLQYDDAISHEQLDFLATNVPDVLRWAIRYSKFFTREKSELWLYLKFSQKNRDWDKFFYVCNELTGVLKPFQAMIEDIEVQLSSLSLIDFLSYLSVLAYEGLSFDANESERLWKIYHRIVINRIQKCSDKDFAITEMDIAKSLKKNLSPIIFPSPGITKHCAENLDRFAQLIYAMGELLDYEGSIHWFCFDEECDYTDMPFQSVIFNKSEQGNIEWRSTNKKLRLLWNYWMNRAVDEFINRGLYTHQFGLAENHELNQLAVIKAIRSELMLKEVYGFSDKLETDTGIHIDVFMFMLFAELNSVFFQKDYIEEFKKIYETNGNLYQSLSMLAFNGLANGMQNRFPMTWSTVERKVNGLVGWSVCQEFPNGNKNITKAIIDSWTVDLKDLVSGNSSLIPRLNERQYYKIGSYLFQFPWVVGLQNNANSAVNNLRRFGARRKGVMKETNLIELNFGEQLRLKGMSVVCGYEPKFDGNENPGEVDIIAYVDDVLLLIEVKSGYIRSSTQEAWLHKTNTLRKAVWQLQRKEIAVKDALLSDGQLRQRLNFDQSVLPATFKSWIVDTSLEFDGQMIDGYHVASLETALIALRDEVSFLQNFEELDENSKLLETETSLYSGAFNIREFINIIESGKIWDGLI